MRIGYPVYSLWFTYSQRLLNYLAFQSFDFEPICWRLFQKRVIRFNTDIYIIIFTPFIGPDSKKKVSGGLKCKNKCVHVVDNFKTDIITQIRAKVFNFSK